MKFQVLPTADTLGQLPDATKREDMETIAEAMRHIPEAQKAFFAYELVYHGLMMPIFDDGTMQPLIDKAKEVGVLAGAMKTMFELVPGSAEELIEAAIDRCLNGKDTTNPNSAGGWNQEEVTKVFASLHVVFGVGEVTVQ